jgi:GH15 family glucan-1,4-alpha-glucosidase
MRVVARAGETDASQDGAACTAATTSLPESLSGARNWDYRYSWLRDATFTLQAVLFSGYTEEAAAWTRWLRRAVAGSPAELQIMYGVGAARRLMEIELDSLPGYHGSRPVRIGNVDGLIGREDTFLMASFWPAGNLALMGRPGEVRHIFERLLGVRNDVGVLSEEYDPCTGGMLGNFPQAFSHVALVNTAANLSVARGPSQMRRARPRGARNPS